MYPLASVGTHPLFCVCLLFYIILFYGIVLFYGGLLPVVCGYTVRGEILDELSNNMSDCC